MIKIKITWPAAILILVALLIWLSRPSAPAQRKPAQQPRRSRQGAVRPEPRKRPDRAEAVIVIDHAAGQRRAATTPDGMPDVTYEEAIRAPFGTYSEDQIDAIAQRELRDTVRDGLESNRDPNLDRVINQFRTRSYATR